MEQDKYRYYLGTSGFSIYEALGTALQRRGDWNRETKKTKMHTCDVVLGDRFDIPYHLLKEGSKPLIINYFKGSHRLTLKASMARTLRDVDGSASYMPLTFVLGGKEGAADELPAMKEYFETQKENSGSVFIVKPSAGCKGQGVLISSSLEEIASFVKTNTGEKGSLFVAQRYIDRPFLIQGRKFDIRVWAMLSHPYNIHVFTEGSCRTASVKYEPGDLTRTHSHLTNHCLQESSDDYGKYEEGNEMWYADFDKYLASIGCDQRVRTHIEPQMDHIIKESLVAVKELIEVSPCERYQCFQLFGYDFILDEALKVHLLEINGSPGSADKWLDDVTSGLAALAIDPTFPPQTAVAEKTDLSKWRQVYPVK